MKGNKKIINENFTNACEQVEAGLGIKLTLIELVELRNLVKFTTETFEKDCRKNGTDELTINPFLESAYIFMNTNYGTQISSRLDADIFSGNKRRTKHLVGYDYYPQYFKRVQEEMHFH
jgi:hypothetical protein